MSKPEFDESVEAGWWRKLAMVKKNVGNDEEDLYFHRLDGEDVIPAGSAIRPDHSQLGFRL